MTGVVVEFVERPDIANLREIADILDPYPLLEPHLLKLTQWIAEYYLASWGEVIRTSLPPGIFQRSQLIITHHHELSGSSDATLSDIDKEILAIVQNVGKISLRKLEKRLNRKNIRFTIAKLERIGGIRVEYVLENSRVQVKSEKWISLCESFDPEVVQSFKKKAPRQAEILSILIKSGGEARRGDVGGDYSILRKLEANGHIEIWEREVFRDAYSGLDPSPNQITALTEEQNRVISQIEPMLNNEFRVFLLHGVTASGKTQVYLETIQKVLDQGKTALVLIPEISLTPQAVHRYRGRFGDRVAVLHSRMSPGERYDSWRMIREGKCDIALGPRSAVFAPLKNLGLVIVDEEHETSYKQIDPAPRYHARDVAVIRGKFHNCVVILGSATPSIESYYNSLNGKYTLCQLSHRVDHIPLPLVNLVDRNEKNVKKDNGVISPLLRKEMSKRLERGEQVILLQNRRGYAPFLRCSGCATIEECPNCDITLTYHQKDHRLRCHYCGFQKWASDTCPSCGGATLQYRGIGTQRVEEEIHHLFPKAELLRMDQDTTRRKGSHDRIIMAFEKGKGDVLLGTQMVAKGHDFPGVNLVGIISADTGLHFPDFRSGEKTFQLLTQAAGRAGRRDVRGDVIIQTYSPESPILKFAMKQDYVQFYQWEIEQREELGYPPWGRLVAVRFKGVEKDRVAKAAQLFSELIGTGDYFQRLGPASSPLSRIKRLFRYQVICKGNGQWDPSGRKLRACIRKTMIRYLEGRHFPDVRVGIDVDPMDML